MAKSKQKTRRVGGGLLIKIIILVLLVAIGFQLQTLRRQVAAAEAEKERYAQQIQLTQSKNEALKADIAEGNSSEKMEELARDELGWAKSDEYVFYDKRN